MSKCICTILVILSLFQAASVAKETKYPVSAIPDSLKANAKAVVRNWDLVFEIKSIGKGVESVSYAITILNENGLKYAVFNKSYSQKLQRIHSINGTIYNSAGEKIESLIPDKIIDHSAISGYSLYEDNRVKVFQPKTMTYPFTVEYSYVCEHVGLLSYPTWKALGDYNIAVEKISFTLVCPNNLSFRYLERNLTEKVEITRNENETSYKWKAVNLNAMLEQPFSEPFSEFCPTVICAPNDFELESFKGNMASWKNFGDWIARLNGERGELSDETKSLLREKVKECTSDYEKARLIYEYMQQRTRYLNIAVGIGGYQPIPAETVDRLGYGDCKALSNYTRSLLDAIGIRSYYALVCAGKNVSQTLVDFPNNQFNHVILCLPMADDTLWLECTSQHLPFGYIGSFTDDRDALAITENGGKLFHTRVYTASENQMIRNVMVKLDATGNATLSSMAMHHGVLYDDKMRFYLAGTEDKKKMILDEVNLPGATLMNFDYQDIRSELPAIKENLSIDVPRYGTLSGARMLIPVIPLDRQRDVPKKVNNRKSNVIIQRAEISIDSIIIAVPEGYTAEALPGEIKAESKFGDYSVQTVARENLVICTRKLEFRKGKYPPEQYIGLIEFYKKIAAGDNTKISLKKAGA